MSPRLTNPWVLLGAALVFALGYWLLAIAALVEGNRTLAAVSAAPGALSLFVAGAQRVLFGTPKGIQLRHRFAARNAEVTAAVTVSFEPVERPGTNILETTLKQWDGTRSFKTRQRSETSAGKLVYLEVYSMKLGSIIEFRCNELAQPGPLEPHESELVTLVLPKTRRGIRTVIRIIENPLDDVLAALAPQLGDPIGLSLDADIDPAGNPFYSMYVRDDIARIGVAHLSAELSMISGQDGDRVAVTDNSLQIQARSRSRFVRSVRSYLSFGGA